MHPCAAVATIVGLAVCESLTASTASQEVVPGPNAAAEWEFSLSTFTYLGQHTRDYANPNFTADRDWLHVEVRYNYEAIKTGSIWLGYNWSTGKKLQLEVTPMLGGVFGDITGIAPGYTITVHYKPIELSTQGEYFFDDAIHSGNFFYSWSELGASTVDWLRIGVVVERTQALGHNSDVRRGPLVGFKYKDIDLTTYWLSPSSSEATFVFAVTVKF